MSKFNRTINLKHRNFSTDLKEVNSDIKLMGGKNRIEFIRQPETRPNMKFLNLYDRYLSEQLFQGAGVRICTSWQTLEASWTRWTKILVIKKENLSEAHVLFTIANNSKAGKYHYRTGRSVAEIK
ncbi:MAG: hypothetical protein Q8880_01595 [Bacteroidota bacterium]|nr:hypothetical protein [Bacteroidota bacterium]